VKAGGRGDPQRRLEDRVLSCVYCYLSGEASKSVGQALVGGQSVRRTEEHIWCLYEICLPPKKPSDVKKMPDDGRTRLRTRNRSLYLQDESCLNVTGKGERQSLVTRLGPGREIASIE